MHLLAAGAIHDAVDETFHAGRPDVDAKRVSFFMRGAERNVLRASAVARGATARQCAILLTAACASCYASEPSIAAFAAHLRPTAIGSRVEGSP